MALKLNFDLCVINGCSQIRFTENTGFYSSINLTGWGDPNVDTSMADTATLTVTTPSGVVYTIDLYGTSIFPTNIAGTGYDLVFDAHGAVAGGIEDGQWLFVYTVSGVDDEDEPFEYTTTIYKYFYCNSECCVTSMLPDISDCDCCEESSDYKNYILAWTQLQSLKKAAACGDSANFAAIKKIVDKLCLNSGCKTCK